ncbi:NUDIX hydrolase [Neglectibacter caecimuris]|jgi:ADP-ribose pyrophosphatase|uniref:NUDIX hydrolase n=1 Tax=Neglectibacter caecimuris TaxID=3093658 RepID=UPI002AC91515|nr:NUDIX hydrolase [Neglectibacter sp. M00184]
MKLTELKKSEREIYNGKIIRVHVDEVELENGKLTKREVVEHPGGVSVAILTEKNELILVRQFRYPYGKVLLELPAGKLEPGEDPFEAMKREQREETGTTAETYVSLGNIYPTPGYAGEIIRLWACRLTRDEGTLHLDEGEFLTNERIPLQQAVEMVLQNEIPDAKTQIGILKTAKLVEQGIL